LFTSLDFFDTVYTLFSKSLEPLLHYLEANYGPSFYFDTGSRIREFTLPIIPIRGITLEKTGRLNIPNFHYNTCTKSVRELPFWSTLRTTINEKDSGKVFMTELTIIVPSDPSDPFWSSTDVTWNHENDDGTEYYECMITKYGGSRVDAEWRATTSAIELIRCARNNYQVMTPLSKSSPPDCTILELGRTLHNEFKTRRQDFTSKNRGFWRHLDGRLNQLISKESRENVLLLLKYYQVHPPFHLFPYFQPCLAENQSCSLLGMGNLEKAIELLKEVERCVPTDLSHRWKFMEFVEARRVECEAMLN